MHALPSRVDERAIRQKARAIAGDGRFQRYKTTQEYDGLLGQIAHDFY